MNCFCTYFCMYIQVFYPRNLNHITVSAPIFVCTYRGAARLPRSAATVSAPIFVCTYRFLL